jgi:hypothetical protein
MIPRRQLVGGGLLGGVIAALDVDAATATPPADPAAVAVPGADLTDAAVKEVTTAITRLRQDFQEQRQFAEIAQVRDAQKTFLRANGKFPDFMEVGSDVWLQIHDWHVRWQQPMTVGRDQTGRYTIQLLGTIVIMKLDAAANFVGQPFDGR